MLAPSSSRALLLLLLLLLCRLTQEDAAEQGDQHVGPRSLCRTAKSRGSRRGRRQHWAIAKSDDSTWGTTRPSNQKGFAGRQDRAGRTTPALWVAHLLVVLPGCH